MKKYLLIMLAAATVAAAASCSKEETFVEQPEAATSCRTIKAVFDPETKASVDGLKFAFTKGDGITVYNGADHTPVYYDCDTVSGGVATFVVAEDTPNQPVEGMELIATFPRRSATTGAYVEDGQLQIMLPVNHSGATKATAGYDPTAIPFVAYNSDSEGTLSFKQTCGIIELTLKGDKKISKITLTSEDAIGGKCTVNYKDAAPVVTMTGTTKTVNYTYKDVQLTAEGTKFYFGVPLGAHNITFTFSDNTFGSMEKTATGISAARGQMIPTSLTYSSTVNPTELDANGTYANCYVIPEAGVYCFSPVKPDGTAVECTSADWVWATSAEWNPTTWDGFSTTDETYYNKLADNVKLIDGKIYVNATMSTTGNLTVGALDADGKLQWSWNLWLTKNLADVTAGDYTWMDRNLGAGYKTDVTNNTATQTNAARGMYYQAGRKDPILGPHGNGADTFPNLVKNAGQALYVYNSKIAGLAGWCLGEAALATDSDALNAPLTLVKSQANLPNYTADACWTSNSNPCPNGYIVATNEAFTALGTTATITANGNSKQAELSGVVFPVSGYRNASTGARTGSTTDARLWTSTQAGTEANPCNVNYCKMLVSTGAVSVSGSGRANGNSVRCIKK